MKIEKIIHRNEPRLLIELAYSKENIDAIKKVGGARWSVTYMAWHIPLTVEAFEELTSLFPDAGRENRLGKTLTGNLEILPCKKPEKQIEASVKITDAEIYVTDRKTGIKMARTVLILSL